MSNATVWENAHKPAARAMARILKDRPVGDFWASSVKIPESGGLYLEVGSQQFPRERNGFLSVTTPIFPDNRDWMPVFWDLSDVLRGRPQATLSKIGKVKYGANDKGSRLWVVLRPDVSDEEAADVLAKAAADLAVDTAKIMRKPRKTKRAAQYTREIVREAMRIRKIEARERLIPALRRAANSALSKVGLDGRGRFSKPQQGFALALNTLSEFGIEPDGVVSSHLFKGPKGSLTADLAFSTEDSFSPQPISNSLLRLDFEEIKPGRFEVVAYLS